MSVELTSEEPGIVRQWGMMVEGMCANYGGGPQKLERAKGHPGVKARFFALLDELAKERELMLPLLERGPKFSVPLGEFETSAGLIAALDAVGLAYFDSDVRKTMLPRITLSKEKRIAESYRATPGDLGKTGVTRRDTIYADAGKLGLLFSQFPFFLI